MEYFTLNDGNKIPALGMGTFPLNHFSLVRAEFFAIAAGYELFDTSAAYGNERFLALGRLLSLKCRRNLFITSKISNHDRLCFSTAEALKRSLKRLRLDYLDLYLIHWPMPGFEQTWKDMVDLKKDGLIRSIGVANFHQHHLESLFRVSDVVPAVNQIELHPLLNQRPLVNFCAKHGIQVEAYSPVARMHEKLIKNSTLKALSEKYQKSVPQIIFRWNFQNHVIAIPKASKKARLIENISIFDFQLSEDDMNQIDTINANFRVRHDPDNCDFSRL